VIERLSVKEVLNREDNSILLDVRTPAEFDKGHIPGAYNFPLFSNEERARVGTLYKQASPEQALLEGLELVGPKLRDFVERATVLAPARKVVLYCWRGGNRSGSLSWLLDLAGFDVYQLVGGYKAYRQYIHHEFETLRIPFIILGGETGAGKTLLLHRLREKGEQMIDLEAIANHKGSAFGGLGQGNQPSVEYFENLLHASLSKMDANKRVWIENESRAIGRVYIPEKLWGKLLQSPLIDLCIPVEDRVKRLVQEYAEYPTPTLKDAFLKIRKRLGGQHLKAALEALDQSEYEKAVRIGLHYYDKAYRFHTIHKRDHTMGKVYPFSPGTKNLSKMADEIIAFAQDL
jgi:tRNA 2-selenouridine synthase